MLLSLLYSYSSLILTHEPHQKYLEGLLKLRLLGSPPVSQSISLEQDPQICISNELPGETDATKAPRDLLHLIGPILLGHNDLFISSFLLPGGLGLSFSSPYLCLEQCTGVWYSEVVPWRFVN